MPEHAIEPIYRYRGHVKPSAEVARPVAVHRAAAVAEHSDATRTGASSATLDIFDVLDSFGGWWGISAADVDAALNAIGNVDVIYVRLNSPGGEATEGVAIANLLRAHSATVRMTVYGIAASAASIIATAGDHLNMAPGSVLMIHDASGFAFGTATDMQAGVNMLDAVSDSYAGLYALKAGGTAEQWRTTMRATTWYTPDTAVAAGLADAIGLDPLMPGDLPPVETVDEDDPDADVIEIDIQINPAARAAARRFDLSMLPAAALATKTPAEPPVAPPTDHKEADIMSDTIPTEGLRERLGIAENADEATILAALDEALAEQAEPAPAAAAENETELALVRRELAEAQTQLSELVTARASDDAKAKAAEKTRVFAEAEQRGVVNPADHPKRVQLEADYDEAPAVVARILSERPAGSVVPVKSTGYGIDAEHTDGAQDAGWFPQFNTTPKVEA